MNLVPRPAKRLLIEGEWITVEPPLPIEMQALQDDAPWLKPSRRVQIGAWFEACRREATELTFNDRRFLQALRIAAWENEDA